MNKSLKKPIHSLTWLKDSSYDRWYSKEYPFKINPNSSYQVRKYDLFDNEKLIEGTHYALENAQDAAKKLYRQKIKKGDFTPIKEQKKEVVRKNITFNNPVSDFRPISYSTQWSIPPHFSVSTTPYPAPNPLPSILIDSVADLATRTERLSENNITTDLNVDFARGPEEQSITPIPVIDLETMEEIDWVDIGEDNF